MSKALKRSIFLLPVMLLSLFCSSITTAEEIPLALGDHFFFLGNYDAAITEYKRLLFFYPDDVRVSEVYYNIGLAYRAQRLWQKAITAMRTAVHHATDREKKTEYQLALAVTLIANQNYDLARLELIKVMMRSPSVPLYRRAMFLQTVAYLYQFRWEEARKALQNYTADERLDELFASAINTPQKSVKAAKILSAVLLGAGQVYAGNWLDGLNALVLNGALGFIAVDAVLDGHYVDAALWATTILFRYYQGNLYHAGKAVEAFNEEGSRQAAEKILERLQEIVEPP